MSRFCTAVAIVTGCHKGTPSGFTAQSFVALSLDPELIAVCPAKNSDSWPSIQSSGAFCVNFLKDSQKHLSNRFAQTEIDRFENLSWSTRATGSPVLEDSMAYVDCSLFHEVDAGDHTIAIGKVEDLGLIDPDANPLLFYLGTYRKIADPKQE